MTAEQESALKTGIEMALTGIAMAVMAFAPQLVAAHTHKTTLTCSEAFAHLKCSKAKFYKLIAEGELPEGVLIAGRKQWSIEDLDAYKQRQFAGAVSCPVATKPATAIRKSRSSSTIPR